LGCLNVASNHQKGHQVTGGKAPVSGYYVRGNDPDHAASHFFNAVSSEYRKLLPSLHSSIRTRIPAAAAAGKLQRQALRHDLCIKMWNCVRVSGTLRWSMQSCQDTCFACLLAIPSLKMPCGHILCDKCVQDVREPLPPGSKLNPCPLCDVSIPDFQCGLKSVNELAPLVASSILLDLCRKKSNLVLRQEDITEDYREFWQLAIEELINHCWTCSFIDNGGQKCIKTKVAHSDSHQLEDMTTLPGSYDRRSDESGFDDAVFRKYQLQRATSGVLFKGGDRRSILADNQRKNLRRGPYLHLWNDIRKPAVGRSSQKICFGCLIHAPSHVLPCGHMLCDFCVDDFSEHDGLVRTLQRCPLCRWKRLTECENLWPWIFKRCPPQAAPRILCLDG